MEGGLWKNKSKAIGLGKQMGPQWGSNKDTVEVSITPSKGNSLNYLDTNKKWI